jgi:predicted enzyme related to lactoylglutathione lyase
MTLQLTTLTIDAYDPAGLARFWAGVLRWRVGEQDEEGVVLDPTDGTRFDLFFAVVPDTDQGVDRMHFDLSSRSVDGQHATVQRAVDLGARHIDVGQGPDAGHVVLADPEGNEFCVLEPGNRFVDYGGVLGSLTCDGSPAVGYFWSQALGWPLVWDQDDETAIRAPDGTGQFITWGPPVIPKTGKNKMHLDIAPPIDGDQRAEVDRLISLGAHRVDIGQGDVRWVVMADPDGNEFCVLTPR